MRGGGQEARWVNVISFGDFINPLSRIDGDFAGVGEEVGLNTNPACDLNSNPQTLSLGGFNWQENGGKRMSDSTILLPPFFCHTPNS